MTDETPAITLLHLDDEPQTVDWIPPLLFQRFVRRRQTQFTEMPNPTDENEGATQRFSWTISVTSSERVRKYQIVYIICSKIEHFQEQYCNLPLKPVICLLDLMGPNVNSKPTLLGLEAAAFLDHQYYTGKLIVLSAFISLAKVPLSKFSRLEKNPLLVAKPAVPQEIIDNLYKYSSLSS